MFQNYLNEEFLNGFDELCRVIEGRKKFKYTHITYENLTRPRDCKHIIPIREYEIMTAFGSWRVVTKTGRLLYV